MRSWYCTLLYRCQLFVHRAAMAPSSLCPRLSIARQAGMQCKVVGIPPLHRFNTSTSCTAEQSAALRCEQEAERLAQEAHKTAGEGWKGPNVDKELARSVEYHQSSIADAIEKANTDNARIYFQRVPNSVPQVQPAVMVTSAAPQGGCTPPAWCSG